MKHRVMHNGAEIATFQSLQHAEQWTIANCPAAWIEAAPKPNIMCAEPVELQFMVVPELLASMAVVRDPVRVKIVDPEAIFLTGLLGESGRKLVAAGVEFYFTKPLAEKLIAKGIAEPAPRHCRQTVQ